MTKATLLVTIAAAMFIFASLPSSAYDEPGDSGTRDFHGDGSGDENCASDSFASEYQEPADPGSEAFPGGDADDLNCD